MKKQLIFVIAIIIASSTATSGQPHIIAHRGHWTAPGSAQNSIKALLKADSIHVYGSEFDVWLTSDDQLIVNHDRIHAPTKIDMERDDKQTITQIKLSNGEAIPTLESYLKTATKLPSTRLILEMKSLSNLSREDFAVAKIAKLVRRYSLEERTDFISFSLNTCLAFRKLFPKAKVYYLGSDIAPKKIAELQLTGIDYSAGSLRAHPEWIAHAQALNLEVNVWTVNSKDDMLHFIEQGVDYITTDYPELLQQLLKK